MQVTDFADGYGLTEPRRLDPSTVPRRPWRAAMPFNVHGASQTQVVRAYQPDNP